MQKIEILVTQKKTGEQFKIIVQDLTYSEYKELYLNYGSQPQLLNLLIIERMIREIWKYDVQQKQWKRLELSELPGVVFDEIIATIDKYLAEQRNGLSIEIKSVDTNPF